MGSVGIGGQGFRDIRGFRYCLDAGTKQMPTLASRVLSVAIVGLPGYAIGWAFSHHRIAGDENSRGPNKSWYRGAVGNQAEESEVRSAGVEYNPQWTARAAGSATRGQIVMVLVTSRHRGIGLLGYWVIGYWVIRVLGYQGIGLSGYRVIRLLGYWVIGLSGYWGVRISGYQGIGVSGYWGSGISFFFFKESLLVFSLSRL